MEFFKIRRTIPFMRYALIFNVISLVTFVAAVFFLVHRGLNYSIEFTGGTLIEVGYQHAADVDKIRRTLDDAGYKGEVQNFGSSRDVLIRLHLEKNESTGQLADKVMGVLKKQDASAEQRRVEYVGPQVGRELAENGALALLVTAVGIVLYLWMRFEWRFGLAAIIEQVGQIDPGFAVAGIDLEGTPEPVQRARIIAQSVRGVSQAGGGVRRFRMSCGGKVEESVGRSNQSLPEQRPADLQHQLVIVLKAELEDPLHGAHCPGPIPQLQESFSQAGETILVIGI